MAKSTLITRFDLNEKSLYVKVTYHPNKEDLFSIKIFDQHCSWSGRFTRKQAAVHRERLEETEEQYIENVKKGLSDNLNQEYTHDFEMLIDDNNFDARFSWKKKFTSAVLLHGSVTVSRDEMTGSKDFLLNDLLYENQELKKSVDAVTKMNKDLHIDLEKCKSSLEKAVELKAETEEALYAKFVELLNEKKRRIQLLEESISNFSKS